MTEESLRSLVVIHVGPRTDAQGGVSSVMAGYARSSLSRIIDLRFIATSETGSIIRRMAKGMLGLARVALTARSVRVPAVFHLHMASRGSYYRKRLALGVMRRRGIARVVHLHGGEFHHFYASRNARGQRSITRTMQSADAVLVLSDTWRQRVLSFAPRARVHILPNAIVLPESWLTGNGQKVCFMGRIGPRKGVPELLESINAIQTLGDNVTTWVLAGDGETDWARQRVQSLPYPDRVCITGWLSREDTAQLLSESGVFVLPSHNEGLPMSLLEAMAQGCACVVTAVGGIPDVVVDGRNGLLVEAGSVTQLTEALSRVLQDVGLRTSLGVAARKTCERDHDIEIVVARLDALYRDLLAEKGM